MISSKAKAYQKDKKWRFYKEAREFAKETYCTKKELDNPSERNIQKCMREIQTTRKVAEPFKRIGKELGESTNISNTRRGR